MRIGNLQTALWSLHQYTLATNEISCILTTRFTLEEKPDSCCGLHYYFFPEEKLANVVHAYFTAITTHPEELKKYSFQSLTHAQEGLAILYRKCKNHPKLQEELELTFQTIESQIQNLSGTSS